MKGNVCAQEEQDEWMQARGTRIMEGESRTKGSKWYSGLGCNRNEDIEMKQGVCVLVCEREKGETGRTRDCTAAQSLVGREGERVL